MIGGEHKKERFSERLRGSQNQPKNRGYLPGTALRTDVYTTETLLGNWAEEHADMGYYDGLPALTTEKQKLWQTTYRDMTGKPKTIDSKKNDLLQETLIEIVDRVKSAYPGHQPHADPEIEEIRRDGYNTTMKDSYIHPKEAQARKDAYVPLALGGLPYQSCGIMRRLRRQLELNMPSMSAFPGNVARTVRHALQKSCTDPTGEINIRELLEGLQLAGINATESECTALIRCLSEKHQGTASLYSIVIALRGELTERREQLVRTVYKLLESFGEKGIVRLEQMLDLVDIGQLRQVKSGEVALEAAQQAFEEQWDARDRKSYIDVNHFLTFFGDTSFEIPTDNEFEILMRNLWHLSGGHPRCANTSCQRVEVVHLTGRVTHEEIKNDLNTYKVVAQSDHPERIWRDNLAKQGIKNIKSIKLLPPM